MNITTILTIITSFFIVIAITYYLTTKSANKKISAYSSLKKAIDDSTESLEHVTKQLGIAKAKLAEIDNETKDLQLLKENADKISSQLESNLDKFKLLKQQASETSVYHKTQQTRLKQTLEKIDLYSHVEELIDYGHVEMPEYLYETSARFTEEIKNVRQQQKELIKDKVAVICPSDIIISDHKPLNKKILNGQIKLMLSAFNIECDLLIAKVTPSSFPRTLERIEKLANGLEKSAATLSCGFNIKYIELKYEECKLQYQHKLKRQDEQEEQRLIREQIREEQKAIKEYERAIAHAEKEEKMYREMLQRAKKELEKSSDENKLITEQRIKDLELQLANAEATEARAKSMAEQTRKGHVYVISNIGSFGEGIYKIGLTRRLEPMDRVKELGDASVPFLFDVHAMIYTDDAPTLEKELHKKFTQQRVNAVNMRKEFFKVDLSSIKDAVKDITSVDADFKMTALAEDYYETQRLQR